MHPGQSRQAPADHTDLLVIGAGPYAYSMAAYARDNGISTRIVGRPMAFWRDQMPADMYLRSGPDWHLDANGEDTFEAYFEDKGFDPTTCDPIPISVFLDHTDWFAERKGLAVEERMVAQLTRPDGVYRATMADGGTITATAVVAVPGVAHYAALPDWATDIAEDRRSHTSELVRFEQLAGARVVIIGGRQSAYEWAALLCDHGAQRVDVIHRHDTPAFARASWKFVDDYIDQTLMTRGWWRQLSANEQAAIAAKFWQVGRLTLEHWLVPRLKPDVVHRHPGCEVVSAGAASDGEVRLALSDGEVLRADQVVFASGYRAALARVPYLAGVIDQVSVTDGSPDLSEGFETTLPGLYLVGFSATRDFGPFYGFTKGCPSAARIAIAEMLR